MDLPTVRSIQERDLDQFWGLLRAKAEFDGGIGLLKATKEEIANALFGSTRSVSAIVAESGDKLVGIVTYFHIFSTFLARPGIWLDDLFVDEDYRSQGTGKLLLSALATIARQRGAKRIDWTVASSNERGREFYRRCGASIQSSTFTARLDENAIERLTRQAEHE